MKCCQLKKAFSLAVISVNVREILCDIYLLLVWVADRLLRGTFMVNDELWRSGPVCFAAFGNILWHNILSELVLDKVCNSQQRNTQTN